MRRVFECWPQVAARVRSADSIALFLDFDGTLAPIEATPDDVHLSQPTRFAINRLALNERTRVWVISGRRRDDIRERVRLARVQYLGVHGWESRFETALDPEILRELADARRSLENSIGALRGVWIEDKGSAFAIHYRGAEEAESTLARAAMLKVTARLNGSFRLLNGKKVWEILPRQVGDKGSAVRRELSRFEHRPLPIYIGDDMTDERAFAALPDGLTIRVGTQALTRAQYQLRDPAEVRRFLVRLEFELSRKEDVRRSAGYPRRVAYSAGGGKNC
jgi:trehalose 6-phosphate phosphatase